MTLATFKRLKTLRQAESLSMDQVDWIRSKWADHIGGPLPEKTDGQHEEDRGAERPGPARPGEDRGPEGTPQG